MKDTTTQVLGYDVPVTGQPTSLQECIAAAGGEQNMVDQWVDYITYHKTNTAARSAVVDALEEVTQLKRATKTEKSKTGKDIEKFTESEQTYNDRVIAQLGKNKREVWDMIREEVGSIPFRAEAREGVGRLAKQDTVKAQTLIDNDGAWQKAVQLLTSKNPGLQIEMDEAGKPKVESLAAGLRTNRKRVEAEANAELGITV